MTDIVERLRGLVYQEEWFEEAAAEIERLRAALTELAMLGEQGMKPNYGEWLTFHDKVAKVARTALVGDGQSTNNTATSEK